jgi:4-hydroxybutyrate CoA-transferase
VLNWQVHYSNRIVTADEAVKNIKSGDRVVLGHACGEPRILPKAMVDRSQELRNVEIMHMVAMGQGLYCLPEMEGHFRHNSLFVGASTRKAVAEDRADYTPCFFSQIPALFRDTLPVDVALVTVTPPDQHGFCSLGVSVDYTLQSIKSARTVIAEVNPNMPRTLGNSYVRVEEIDYFVPSELPIIELPRPMIGVVEKEIGRNIAKLIEDGATLQLGIGAIPDAVLSFLTEKNDLGIHSEMFSDGVMDLAKKGIINCAQKTLHRGKMVVTFLMGTRKLYDWIHENPMVEMFPVDYVNDPFIIAKNDKMVSINSALQVDLLGQVAADTLGTIQFSGVGGQVDFVRGAARSRGGKSVIALPATADKGKVSRIVPLLTRGAAVTTSRFDVDYVVTEFGIASLRGKTVKERMQALVEIAHPDFREQISSEARSIYFN